MQTEEVKLGGVTYTVSEIAMDSPDGDTLMDMMFALGNDDYVDDEGVAGVDPVKQKAFNNAIIKLCVSPENLGMSAMRLLPIAMRLNGLMPEEANEGND